MTSDARTVDKLERGVGRLPAGVLRHLALAVVWLLLWRVSALMEYAPYASIWFPPSGLSFAALLLMGWRALPVLTVCAIGVTFWQAAIYDLNLTAGTLLATGALFAASHCAAYGTGAGLLRHMVGRSTVQSTPSIAFAFLAAACLSSLAAALLGAGALHATGLLDAQGVADIWLPWWIGDMAGVLVLAPLFIGTLSWRYPGLEAWMGGLDFGTQEQGMARYLAKLGLSVLLVSIVLLVDAALGHQEVAYAMFFLILPQMWITYTESPLRTAVSLAAFSTVTAVWVAVLGQVAHALVFQFAICVIAANAYFGLAVPVLLARNRKLTHLASTDGLTGAATKRHFFERAEAVAGQAHALGRAVAMVVLDIDCFKQINDRYGHVAGDKTLRVLTQAVQQRLRPADLCGRFGGDEFTLLLPGLGEAQARQLTDRLRKELLQTTIPGTDEPLSVSFGVASLRPGEAVMEAFQRADERLMAVKQENAVASRQDRAAGEET